MVDKEKALQMRRDGATLNEIGNTFGVSGEYIRQILKHQVRNRKNTTDMEKIVYEGIYNWLMANPKMTFPAVARLMFGHTSCGYTNVAMNLLHGKNCRISKQAYDRLMAATGMTYEQLFKLREGFSEGGED
jgi:hypothetical protein